MSRPRILCLVCVLPLWSFWLSAQTPQTSSSTPVDGSQSVSPPVNGDNYSVLNSEELQLQTNWNETASPLFQNWVSGLPTPVQNWLLNAGSRLSLDTAEANVKVLAASTDFATDLAKQLLPSGFVLGEGFLGPALSLRDALKANTLVAKENADFGFGLSVLTLTAPEAAFGFAAAGLVQAGLERGALALGMSTDQIQRVENNAYETGLDTATGGALSGTNALGEFMSTGEATQVEGYATAAGLDTVTGGGLSGADAVGNLVVSRPSQAIATDAAAVGLNTATGGALSGVGGLGEFMSTGEASEVERFATAAGLNTATGGGLSGTDAVGSFITSGQSEAVASNAVVSGLNTATGGQELLDILQRARQEYGDLQAEQQQLSQSATELNTQIQDAQGQSAALQKEDAVSLQQAQNSISAPTITTPVTTPASAFYTQPSGTELLNELFGRLGQLYNSQPQQQPRAQPAQNPLVRNQTGLSDCGFISGYAARNLQACMYVACLFESRCLSEMVGSCQSDYAKNLAWEQSAMAACRAGYPVQVPNTGAQPTAKK